MLGRRRLRVGYGEQTVRKTKRNADAFETQTLLDDEIRQQRMTVPGHEDSCKPKRPACNLSAKALSASVIGVGAASSHFNDAKTSRAAAFITDCISAVQGVLECNSPAAVAPDTTPVTGRQS